MVPSSRPSSFVRRELRKEVVRFARLQAADLVKIGLVTVAVCVVPLLVGTPPYLTGLLHGVMVMSVLGVIGLALVFYGRTAHLLAGSWGESYTQEELEGARKAGHVWGSVHNVELSDGDIDHVVLTPSGVLALETKWRFGLADRDWLDGAVRQAARRAQKTRTVLRSKGLDEVHDVRPVLVVWGGGRRDLPKEQVLDGVTVLAGDHLVTWLETCATGPMAQDNAEALHQRLEAFKAARVPA